MQLKIFVDGSAKLDHSRDNSGNFYNQLLNAFEKNNLRISTLEESDLFVSVNHSSQAYRKFQKLGKKKNQAILIRLEPASIFPAQYKKRILDRYGLVITTGRKEKDDKGFYSIPNPYSFLPNPNLQMKRGVGVNEVLASEEFNAQFDINSWNNRDITISLIAGNKVSCSKQNNYGLRRDIASALPREFLLIYGELWNANFKVKLKHRAGVAFHGIQNGTIPNFRSIYGSFFKKYLSFVGTVADKHEIVKRSKFSLVIENSNQYVSEKVIDAMINGSIPVYFGPNLEEFGFPGRNIAITNLSSPSEIMRKINSLSNEDIQQYLNFIKKFLKSESFTDNYIDEVVYGKIAYKIMEFYEDFTTA
jgi:hypothetical protein